MCGFGMGRRRRAGSSQKIDYTQATIVGIGKSMAVKNEDRGKSREGHGLFSWCCWVRRLMEMRAEN